MANTRTPKDDENKVLSENIREKFKKMFLNQEPPAYASVREVEAMQARILELETELAEKESLSDQHPSGSVSETVTQPSRVEATNQSRTIADPTFERQEKPKEIALWISGTLIGVTVAFFGFSIYAWLILQRGKLDASDPYLIPFTFLMVLLTLGGHILIRRGHLSLGSWMLYLFDAILLPFLMVLFLDGLVTLAGGYLVIFAVILIALVIPQESRWKAVFTAVGAVLAMAAIEIWHPGFRTNDNHIETLVPFLIGLAFLVILIYIVRQAFIGSIRIKLITSFLVIALLSTGIVAGLAQRSLTASLTENIGTNIATLAQGKALEIGAILDRDKDTLESLALNKVLQDQLDAANILDTTDPNEISRLDQQWRSAPADNDQLIWNVMNNPVARQLRKFQSQFPQYVELFVTDKNGENTASTNRTSDFYQADEEWWQTAWNNGQGGIFMSQPVFDDSAGIYAIDIALPIEADDHSGIIGILRATVDVTPLKETLLAGQFGQTGQVDLVFPDDQLLSSQLTESKLSLNPESAIQLQSLNAAYGKVDYQGVPSLVSRNLVSASSAGDKENLQALGWYVIVHQAQAEALQPVTAQTRNIIILAVLISVATIIAAFYLARMIANPISHLNTIAAKLAAGDLTIKAKVETRDEVGTLATTFNNMTSQLRDLLGSLEQRVAERTRDLELATEVGRTVSQKVGNLDELLSEATQLIRDRFHLYYTQIYLIDPGKHQLVLRAGTGEVGKELMKLGHRLIVGSGSINGRAALNQQAVIVTDTTQSENFLPNPLLPNTNSEMAVPLIAANQVVGVLDMQSEQPGALNESNLAAFEALAGQLAIAIQNASLLAEAEQARSEMELQARRLASSGWQEFLNGIQRGEQLSYAFDQTKVVPAESIPPVESDSALRVPISIVGTEVGAIQLTKETDYVWTESESEFVQATADLLARHVENLRLLAQAEQYRFEAEQVSRRLTQEGWNTFLENSDPSSIGYVYNLNKVEPLSGNGHLSEKVLKQPLAVRDETIGELTVQETSDSEEATEILEAIAEQLSGHIENLRLSELNEKRAQREQTLRQITSALRSSNNPTAIMRTAVRELGSIMGRKTVLQLAKTQSVNQAESVAGHENESDTPVHQS